jgi:long-chain acyl-CoA synthetase
MAPGADLIPAEQARTLAGLLLERVRRTPDGVAYVQYDPASDRWTETTWREAAAEVGRWQAALEREGLAPGDRVALQVRNCREWVYFDLAALGLGLVTVPLYTNDRPENVRHVLTDAGVRLLLLESAAQLAELAPIADTLAGLDRVLLLETDGAPTPVPATPVAEWLAGTRGDPVDRVEHGGALATIVYTSGTTGPPKGVMLSHGNLLWNASASLSCIQAFPQDRFLSFLPLSHTLERTGGYYLPMMAGSSVAYARSIPQLAEDLTLVRPTVMIAVPRIFERVHGRIREKLEAGPALARRLFAAAITVGFKRFEHGQGRRGWSPDLLAAPLLDRLVGRKVRARLGGRLRITVSGGAPLAPDVARFFIGLGIPLVQGYGLTEASPVVSVSPLEDNIPESVGVPLPGVEIRVGPQDELLVRSPGVMSGYWGHPQASAAAVDRDGWLRTGDQVRWDGRHLFITGRIKEIIVLSNGRKVAPGDLELAIGLDGLFAQVLVIGEGRPYLAALAVLDPERYARLAGEAGLDPDLPAARLDPRLEEILLARVAERLRGFPGYAKIPRLAVVERPWSIEDGMMTPTMKLRRARILAEYRDDVERLYRGHT